MDGTWQNNFVMYHLSSSDPLRPTAQGPSTLAGSAHNLATAVQRQAGGGTFAAERRIGYKALRSAGISVEDARAAISRVDEYFGSIGVGPDTITRIPGNR